MELNERLKAARIKRGYKFAADAARALGVPYGTYSGHEGGSRGVRPNELQHYAKRFRVPIEWLAFGKGSADDALAGQIPVLGYVGLGEEIDWVGEGGQVLEEVDFPLLPNDGELFALIGRGTSMLPLVADGDIVIGRRPDGRMPGDFIGKKAIVKVVDGPYLFKVIQKGTAPDRFHLESFNALYPTRTDEMIETVAEYVGSFQRSALRSR